MGLEGAVRLGFRRELDPIDDPDERAAAFDAMVSRAYEHGKAVHVAEHFEIDDVIDPAVTEAALRARPRGGGPGRRASGRRAAALRGHVVTTQTGTDVDTSRSSRWSREIERLVGAMTLDEKASLTAGASMWYLPPVERLGIPALKVSDGPSGVRGDSLIGRRSLSLPCGMAIGSTWNPDLVRALGDVLAAEARSKGVHVLLGPTVCIVRTPLAGRTFESFSEDPLLTARIAVRLRRGACRRGGVACCIKHFACNDQEHERMTISAEVDERTLREIHLVAFEHAVQEAGVWSVMTAYNKVNGVYCGEQPDLIDGVLRREWGFDGLVDVRLVRDALDRAGRAGRPRPRDARALGLARAHAGRRRARRARSTSRWSTARCATSCGCMGRVGILGGTATAARRAGGGRPGAAGGGPPGGGGGHRPAGQRRAAAAGPADASASVAVIGPNAGQLAMGGGSSEVTPHRRRRVAEALAERLPGASDLLRGRLPHRPRAAADRPAACSAAATTSLADRVLRQPGARRRAGGDGDGAHGPRPVDRPAAAGAHHRRVLGPAVRAPSRPTCRARGSSGSRAPGGPCCASTATSSSTTPSPSGARASTAPAASRSR